jgi:erythrin-vacuolar iron transport family protein
MTEELLATAIQTEIKARDFYSGVAEKVAIPKVKKTLSKIAKEEAGHVSVLSRRFSKVFSKDYTPVENEPDPKVKALETDVLTVDTSLEIVSIAIGMEDEAIEFYSEQAERTEDSEEQKMLIKLARFELGHKKKMQSQMQRLKGGFSWTGKE